MRVNQVVFHARTRHRVVPHGRDTEVKGRFEQAGYDVGRRGLSSGSRPRFGSKDRRQPIEELAHAGRQDPFETSERVSQVALKRGAGDRLEQIATEVKRAELGERKAGLEALEDVTVDPPVDATVFVALIVEGEAGLLKCGKVAPDGACRDFELASETVNRRAVTRGLERV